MIKYEGKIYDTYEDFLEEVSEADLYDYVQTYNTAAPNYDLFYMDDFDMILAEKTPMEMFDLVRESLEAGTFDCTHEYFTEKVYELQSYERVRDYIEQEVDEDDFAAWLESVMGEESC